MPNVQPHDLPIRTTTLPGPGCASNTCVAVELTAEGVVVTSTIEGNDGRVVFTTDEWDAFIPAVKAGAWDHTITREIAPV